MLLHKYFILPKNLKMKKAIVLLLFLVSISVLVVAQAPPPPPSDPSNGGNGPVGGSAPLGSGLVCLLSFAAGYAGFKITKNPENKP